MKNIAAYFNAIIWFIIGGYGGGLLGVFLGELIGSGIEFITPFEEIVSTASAIGKYLVGGITGLVFGLIGFTTITESPRHLKIKVIIFQLPGWIIGISFGIFVGSYIGPISQYIFGSLGGIVIISVVNIMYLKELFFHTEETEEFIICKFSGEISVPYDNCKLKSVITIVTGNKIVYKIEDILIVPNKITDFTNKEISKIPKINIRGYKNHSYLTIECRFYDVDTNKLIEEVETHINGQKQHIDAEPRILKGEPTSIEIGYIYKINNIDYLLTSEGLKIPNASYITYSYLDSIKRIKAEYRELLTVEEINQRDSKKNHDKCLILKASPDELMMQVAFYLSNIDGTIDLLEGKAISTFGKKILERKYSKEEQLQNKEKINTYIENAHKKAKENSININQVLTTINEKFTLDDKNFLFETCLYIAAADGITDKRELDFVNHFVTIINLNKAKAKIMIEKILPINTDTQEKENESLEKSFGITSSMSNQVILDILKKEYKTWNQRVGLSDSSKREEAERMLHKVSEIRKKYKNS